MTIEKSSMKINGSDSIDIGISRLHALDGTFGHGQKRVYMCSMVVLGHTQENMPQELDKFLKRKMTALQQCKITVQLIASL